MSARIHIEAVSKTYPVRTSLFSRHRELAALRGVSLQIEAGTTLGLVGESGSGKSTLARLVMGAENADAGKISIDGRDVRAGLPRAADAWLRRTLQPVLQDPYGALNPRMTVAETVGEPLHIQRQGSRAEIAARVRELLELVGLSAALATSLPVALSGGQRQRVAIARALSISPRVLILDEPVSALDMSVQAQVINLLQDLQDRLGLTYLLISHDLAVVAHLSTQIAVLYLGQVVEAGDRNAVIRTPRHPYTRSLIAAAEPGGEVEAIQGEMPSPLAPPSGCPFHPRCPQAVSECRSTPPALRRISGTHLAACHLADSAQETAA
jgi:oligopeptide/dipeptide ABC transporter ATP-binding protein